MDPALWEVNIVVRLLLVEDHASVRDSLAFLLDHQPDFEVVGMAGSLADGREMLQGIDIALLDLDLPDGSGTALIQPLRAANPEARALILTGTMSRQSHARAIEAGASGVLHKNAPIPKIINTIRRLAAGEPIHPPDELVALLQFAAQQRERDQHFESRLAQLTPREHDLLRSLADGLSDKEIAARHSVSVRTVQTQMTRLLDKLEVHSRLQALLLAARHNVIDIDRA